MSKVISLQAEYLASYDSLRLYTEFVLGCETRTTAEDTLQELWIKLSNYPDQRYFESDAHVRAWFRLCIRHLIVDRLRTLGKGIYGGNESGVTCAFFGQEAASLEEFLAGSFTTPSTPAIRTEQREVVERALQELEPMQRKVIIALHMNKQSRAAVAASFALTTSQIDTIAAKGVSHLKQLLSSERDSTRTMDSRLEELVTHG